MDGVDSLFALFISPRAPPMNTKATQLGRRVALTFGLLAVIGLSSLQAQTSLDFVPFEFSGVSNVSDLDYINVEALIAPAAGGVSIGIFNQSTPGDPGVTSTSPTVTRIFFEDRASVLGNSPAFCRLREWFPSSAATVRTCRVETISISKWASLSPEPRRAPVNGLDPGESIVFLFGGSDYEQRGREHCFRGLPCRPACAGNRRLRGGFRRVCDGDSGAGQRAVGLVGSA